MVPPSPCSHWGTFTPAAVVPWSCNTNGSTVVVSQLAFDCFQAGLGFSVGVRAAWSRLHQRSTGHCLSIGFAGVAVICRSAQW
jgi:hypothetical protein